MLNKAYQELTKEPKKYYHFLKIKGEELIGAKIIPPLGSPDLMYYLNKIAEDMGKTDFMICMDSRCIVYNTLWIITSLRDISKVELIVEVLKESVHSGTGSGIASDSFSIMRQFLDRLEDSKESKSVDDLQVQIPDYRIEDAKKFRRISKRKNC